MGTAAALESVATHDSGCMNRIVSEIGEEAEFQASNFVKRFAHPSAQAAQDSTTPALVSGEQLGTEYAKTYTAALQSFKDNAPDATAEQQAHAARELASLSADVTRKNLELSAAKAAESVKDAAVGMAV